GQDRSLREAAQAAVDALSSGLERLPPGLSAAPEARGLLVLWQARTAADESALPISPAFERRFERAREEDAAAAKLRIARIAASEQAVAGALDQAEAALAAALLEVEKGATSEAVRRFNESEKKVYEAEQALRDSRNDLSFAAYEERRAELVERVVPL